MSGLQTSILALTFFSKQKIRFSLPPSPSIKNLSWPFIVLNEVDLPAQILHDLTPIRLLECLLWYTKVIYYM